MQMAAPYNFPFSPFLWTFPFKWNFNKCVTIIIMMIIIIVIIIIIIIIIIELTHIKTILEITVEIEPQLAALDFKNLSQYSSRSK